MATTFPTKKSICLKARKAKNWSQHTRVRALYDEINLQNSVYFTAPDRGNVELDRGNVELEAKFIGSMWKWTGGVCSVCKGSRFNFFFI